MDPLRISERCPSVRVDRVDLVRVRARGFDIQYEPEFPQQRALEIVVCLRPFWYSFLQIIYDGRGDGEPNRVARLERVLFSNVADLTDIRLDEFKTVSFDRPTPLFELILDATSCRSNPL